MDEMEKFSESSYSESENSESENFESKNLDRMLSLSVKKKDVSVKMSIPRNIIANIRQLWDSICITLFVIGTALVIFVAARNSITWYIFYLVLTGKCSINSVLLLDLSCVILRVQLPNSADIYRFKI